MSAQFNMYEFVLKPTNGSNGHDQPQYHTVPSVPRPEVHFGGVYAVNTALSCDMPTAVQKKTTKRFPDMESDHND